MDKRKILKQSIKRLIDLEISDKEILLNLKDVGIPELQAVEMLAEVKGESKGAVPEPVSVTEQKKEEPVSVSEQEPKEEKISISRAQPKEEPLRGQRDVAELWESGVLVAANEKLEEMEQIKKDIEKIVDSKIKAGLERESKKIDVLFEAKKTMFSQKINQELNKQVKGVQDTINFQIEEIRKLNLATKEDLEKVEAKKTVIKDLYAQSSKLLNETDIAKQELEKEVSATVNDARERIAKLDERISRALALESKITEGLVKDAKDKMDEVVSSKIAHLEKKVNDELYKMKDIEARVNPEKVAREIGDAAKSKILELESKVNQKVNEINLIEAEFKPSEVKKAIDSDVAQKMDDIEKKVGIKINQLDMVVRSELKRIGELSQKVDPEKIEKQLYEDTNIKIAVWEKTMEGKIKKLDKLAELLDPAKIESDINKVLIDRLAESEAKINQKIETLNKIEKAINPGQIQKQLDNAVEAELTNVVRELERYTDVQITKEISQVRNANEKELAGFIAETRSKVNVDEIAKTRDQLNSFKKKFIQILESKLNELNRQIHKFNAAMKDQDKLMHSRIKEMDVKIKELTVFEDEFTKTIETNLKKMSK